MEARIVSGDEGWRWYVCAWKLFVRNPGILVGQTLVLLLIAVALNLVPLIGGLALALITPVLAGGWYYTLGELDSGANIGLTDVFEGFRNKQWTGPLIVLGVAILAAEVLLGLTAVGVLGLTFFADPTTLQGGAANLTLGFGGLIALVIALTLAAAIFAAMFYAIPLVIFQSMAPIAALRSSFWAGIRNWLPLLVFGLIYLVLAILAAIPLGLGFLVLIPLSVCAAFCSYKAIYGPEPAEQA